MITLFPKKTTPVQTAGKMTKSWKFTMATFVIAMILPFVNAHLPEENRVDEEWASNLIYMALGYSAVGAAATAVKRVKPTPPVEIGSAPTIEQTMKQVEEKERKIQADQKVKKNPEGMSMDELIQMNYELKQDLKRMQGKA